MASPTPTSSPNSPLSSIASSDMYELDHDEQSRNYSRDDTISLNEVSPSASNSTPQAMPPAKRRRTGAYDHATPLSVTTGAADDILPQVPSSPADSISSDTSGEVPNSPSFAHLSYTHPLSTAYANTTGPGGADDEPSGRDAEQVTVCKWDTCNAGDLGDMDLLVTHIHDAHIGAKRQKYSCEWEGCSRKGMSHASGYALRAHMRSHTREKPFYCALPECDRSFTRSDALAKHMRTVHETEALRPSDPVPRGHSGGVSGWGSTNGANGPKKLKIIMKDKNATGNGSNSFTELPPLPQTMAGDPIDIDDQPFRLPVDPSYYPSDVANELSEYELSLPPSQLFRLLRRQIHWTEQETKDLTRELKLLQRSADEDAEDTEDEENMEDIITVEANPALKEKEKKSNLLNSDKEAIEAELGPANKARRDGWRAVEALLDDVMVKEVDQAMQQFYPRSANDTVEARIKDATEAWSHVRSLEGLIGQ